jgi:CHAD domain-containing protein
MLQSSRPAEKPAFRVQPKRPHVPRLKANMACDTAFRTIARRHLLALEANHEATCRGEVAALHEMRIALTHLRTDILFFSPMVEDRVRDEIKRELKWLNRQLGAVRDLDVAIERIRTIDSKHEEDVRCFRSWEEKRADGHRQLARSLESPRYRELIERTAAWIESGPWSTRKGNQAVQQRAAPVATYAAEKLSEWERRLRKKGRKLSEMDTKARHRLRLLNKRVNYSIQSLQDLHTDKRFSKQGAAVKLLKKAQRCLGELNDDVNGHALALALEQEGVATPFRFLGPKREKRLLKAATTAYEKLAALRPFQS